MKGHVGKLLVVDLSKRSVETVPTQKFEQWYGGFGLGIALFWDQINKDYLADQSISGLEPDNVVCLMPGPLGGTLAPSGGRTEVLGLAPEAYPRPQFCRSNFGGRWGTMIKFAGYDGIAVKGRADRPVWIDIRDADVQIRDARFVWGFNIFQAQEMIWKDVGTGQGDWQRSGPVPGSRTTQRSAIVAIGKAGENLVKWACLCHDAGNAAGQGGFGAVFGSKNLKAISVLGSGSVPVADPGGIIEARRRMAKYMYDVDAGERKSMATATGRELGDPPSNWVAERVPSAVDDIGRPLGCAACPSCCKSNFKRAWPGHAGGEAICVELGWFAPFDVKAHGKTTAIGIMAPQRLGMEGLNAYQIGNMLGWLETLHKRGLLGPGKKIHTTLDFSRIGELDFVDDYIDRIVNRREIGNDLAEGMISCAAKWGVLEEDLRSGVLVTIYHIGIVHWGDEWAWAVMSLFESRDLNCHDLGKLIDWSKPQGQKGFSGRAPLAPSFSAEKAAKTLARIGAPWHDPLMAARNEEYVYGPSLAKCMAWSARHHKFWKNSAPFCDQLFTSWLNTDGDDQLGASPELEVTFFNAVTGANITYEQGLEVGRRMWNFQRAIQALMGRHRDQEYHPPFPPYDSYVYTKEPPFLQKGRYFPAFENGTWAWKPQSFAIDRKKFDELKSIYFELEGWDTETGRPTRATLEGCGLKEVADVLESRGRLGNG